MKANLGPIHSFIHSCALLLVISPGIVVDIVLAADRNPGGGIISFGIIFFAQRAGSKVVGLLIEFADALVGGHLHELDWLVAHLWWVVGLLGWVWLGLVLLRTGLGFGFVRIMLASSFVLIEHHLFAWGCTTLGLVHFLVGNCFHLVMWHFCNLAVVLWLGP